MDRIKKTGIDAILETEYSIGDVVKLNFTTSPIEREDSMTKKNLWKSYSQDEYVKLEQVNNAYKQYLNFWKNGKGNA